MTPPGRIRLKQVLHLTGISKSTFYTRYRWDPGWAARVGMTLDPSGQLQFSEKAVRRFAVEQLDDPDTRSERAAHLYRFCEFCDAHLGPRSRFCGECGERVRDVHEGEE